SSPKPTLLNDGQAETLWGSLFQSEFAEALKIDAPAGISVANWLHDLTQRSLPQRHGLIQRSLPQRHGDKFLNSKLIRTATGATVNEHSTLEREGITDGEVIALCLEYESHICYQLEFVPSASELFSRIVASSANPPDSRAGDEYDSTLRESTGSHIWGAL